MLSRIITFGGHLRESLLHGLQAGKNKTASIKAAKYFMVMRIGNVFVRYYHDQQIRCLKECTQGIAEHYLRVFSL